MIGVRYMDESLGADFFGKVKAEVKTDHFLLKKRFEMKWQISNFPFCFSVSVNLAVGCIYLLWSPLMHAKLSEYNFP